MVTDANGNSTEYPYDDLGRLKTVKGALDNTTEYTYDAIGNLTKVKDARNNETAYEYDLLSRLTKETKPLGQITEYFYDTKSRLDHKIDAKNQKIEYNYRAVDDAITSIDYFNNAGDSNPAKTVTFGLDNNANILSVTDDSIQSTALYDYTYDALNRVDIFTNNLVNKILDYDYDSFGNRDKLTIKEGPTSIYTIDYSYNKLEQLTRFSGPGGPTTLYYFPTGRLEAKAFPNGVTGNYTYWDNGDLKTLTYASSTAAPLLDLSYTYDNYSNIDRKTKDGVLYDYKYDNIYQLTGVMKNSVPDESFSYDPVSNRLTSGPSSPLLSYSYDNNNQLNSYNGVSFGYDSNGNTISKVDPSGTTSYNYSIDNRLLTVNTPTISASYHYDPMGRRIRKTISGTTTNYLWDENVLLAEIDDSGNILKTYLHNPDTNEPISMTEVADTYWYLNDHLMTPLKLIDSNQTVAWSAEYKAFGKVTIDPSSTVTSNLRFPGQYADSENGLHYNYNRFYNQETGRYITPDPINNVTIEAQKGLIISQIIMNLFRAGVTIESIENLNVNKIRFITAIQNPFKDSSPSISLPTLYLQADLLRIPFSKNLYLYAYANPIFYIDPSGLLSDCAQCRLKCVMFGTTVIVGCGLWGGVVGGAIAGPIGAGVATFGCMFFMWNTPELCWRTCDSTDCNKECQ